MELMDIKQREKANEDEMKKNKDKWNQATSV